MTAPSTTPTSSATAPGASTHRHHRGHHRSAAFKAHLHRAAVQHAGSPPQAVEALKTAMAKEHVPSTWENSLRFIMDRESSGKVGAANKVDTARGLFQLTRASYHLNPNGVASFGNPVEEAQGGIRYIQQRYQTADNAAAFWQKHGWY